LAQKVYKDVYFLRGKILKELVPSSMEFFGYVDLITLIAASSARPWRPMMIAQTALPPAQILRQILKIVNAAIKIFYLAIIIGNHGF